MIGRISSKALAATLALAIGFAAPLDMARADQFSAENAPLASVGWKELFDQLFVWNIQKSGKALGQNDAAVKHRVLRSLYYKQGDFNAPYQTILAAAKTTNDAFAARERLMGDAQAITKRFLGTETLNSSFNGNFNWTAPKARSVAELVKLLEANKNEPTSKDSAYFDTKNGAAVQAALKDYLFVVIPGFGSHTMKNYGYAEIVEAANLRCGRPLLRPSVERAPEGTYQSSKEFHAGQRCGETHDQIGFDVVHPMGNELGNSMGKNLPVAQKLAAWINELPAGYSKKKIILLGYSKGSPIAHTMTAWLASEEGKKAFPGMRERVKFIVTAGGVVQGAIPAESGLEAVKKGVKDANQMDRMPTMAEVVTYIQANAQNAAKLLQPILGGAVGYLGAFLNNATVRSSLETILKTTGVDVQAALASVQRSLETANAALILGGVEDMTPYEVTKWNLQNLHDGNFAGVTVFNLSVLTNVKDFLTPAPMDQLGPTQAPLIAPQLVSGGTLGIGLDWKRLSLDNLFLHATSIGGFQEAPGGLFDTQVAWADTKSIAIDKRPLSASFNKEQIAKLKAEPGLSGISENAPRAAVIGPRVKSVNFVDLGEFRGTHWDLAFRQVYLPPKEISQEHYTHEFPRKAFLTALMETLAVYELMSQSLRN